MLCWGAVNKSLNYVALVVGTNIICFISSLQKQLVEEEASQHYTCMLSCCSCFEEIHYNLHLIYLTYANRNYSKSSLAHYQRMKIMKDRNAHLEIEQTFI